MAENTGDLLMSAARSLRRQYGAALAAWDITPAQSRALRIVCELESARLSVLAERLHIAPRSATEVVDALETRGWVSRVDDASDRRAVCVVPTEEGRRLRTVMDRTRQEQTEEFLAALPQSDRSELNRILSRLQAQ
ncbi:MarR family winged helix-turn-helix transcriptional regulator [Nocardioides sp.]|uniref:MarR family winged helix-turn-helix transcriptional regulator n=1 Tax=Nocardioides sp. TaxID=35761 RepID=UPI003D1103CA